MISFGPMSITLLICALQGLVLAILLLRQPRNTLANRFLALLILAFALRITPYIIGYAGFYDTYPWLSFAPFQVATAFGPLLYFYVVSLTGELPRYWRWHFVPAVIQFCNQALVFPLPLQMKNAWNSFAYEPYIDPVFELTAMAGIVLYGWAAMRRYRDYRRWLDETRTDGIDFDPSWIRNFILALSIIVILWAGFFVANSLNPSRNYFDQFWLYVGFSVLVSYLGVEGWRHAGLDFPHKITAAPVPVELVKDWRAIAAQWSERIDRDALWQNPELTLSSLARILGTNTAYLSRAFNEGLGENFNAVINRRRVEAVKDRLRSPSETRDLTTIALDIGFSSKASFNRAFTDFAGTSPSRFRAAQRLKS